VLDIRLDADAQSSLPCSTVAKLEQFDLDLATPKVGSSQFGGLDRDLIGHLQAEGLG